jgi:hypothetical protein
LSLNPQLSNLAANAGADAIAALYNGGFIDFYDGTQPADAQTSVTTQVLLGSLTFSNPSSVAAALGVAVANAITSVLCAASGTASWARVRKSDHTTAVVDFSVGTSGCDLNMNTVTFVAGGIISITRFEFTQKKTT